MTELTIEKLYRRVLRLTKLAKFKRQTVFIQLYSKFSQNILIPTLTWVY
tara:strand:- start:723 stop:869 length:147 start_codon:yes stop_codon:yes gene_type:complete